MATQTPPLSIKCAVCGTGKDLLRCGMCKVQRYCGRDHQAEHRPAHKAACTAVKKKRSTMEEEEQELRRLNGDIFEEEEGRFWGIHETRPYMRARYAFVEALVKVGTYDAVEVAYDNLRDMLRLCRGDNMGVRDVIPGLLLRLGRDQECYDFIKWWNTEGNGNSFDWVDMDLPYLDVKDADVFESPEYLCREFGALAHTVAATLVKVKVMLDLEDLAALNDLGDDPKKLPQELVDKIKKFTPRSPIVSKNKDIMDGKSTLSPNTLAIQIADMYESVEKRNKHFWQALVNPGRHLGARPNAYCQGSVQEMELVLNYSYAAWAETPGAIQWMVEEFMDEYDFE
ncbi:hypothetical protein BLS_005919 [Venturia inaequalis]|uniref:MYND-type domain-containing protein n=1 Tax=Venturia inaequalis TaxID=5025 RepID=A0A8H3UN91_VENIN|nr:hypothetical protein EG328_004503 [Venturia inaequalis]KAE9982489.1 hypothetical protein BLS_005919 [Venturia inaequalis]KAE9990072.1 hypothetical protein EG327_001883 [Venturia inaequalis]RDI86964.1 hypothetical protein Vi05172_g3012 [Venturia inaequalis]